MINRSFTGLLPAFILLAVSCSNAAAGNVIIGGTPPNRGPAPGEQYTDLQQGLFEWSFTDLKIAGPIPIVMTRVYRSKDISNNNYITRPFGIGFNLNYNMYLYSNSEAANNNPPTYTDAEIVLPNGGQVACHRTDNYPATDYVDAIFQCTSNPDGIFFGATIRYDSNTPGWDVVTKTLKIYSFGLGAPLQSISDRYGNKITLVRPGGPSSNITRISSSNGTYIDLSYTNSNPNLITQATDNSGRVVFYFYDSSNRLAKICPFTVCTQYTQTFGYDSGNHLGNLTTLNLFSNILGELTTTIQYGNTDSSVSQISTPAGAWTYNQTFSGNQITDVKVTDPNGNKVKYFFNSSGYVTQITRASGSTTPAPETTTYSRDPSSNHILSVTDNIGRVTGYGYDSLGNTTSITNLQGTSNPVTWMYGYGNCSQLTSVTDPLQHMISVTQTDSNCDAMAIQDQTGKVWNLTYYQSGVSEMNAAGLPQTIADPLQSGTVSLQYDFSHGPSQIQDQLKNVTNFGHDPVGRLSSITDPLRNITNFPSYDSQNSLLKIIDANNNSTTFSYDGLENFQGWTDAAGNSTSITFSSVGTVEVKSGAGGTATYVYDPVGNLTSYTDKRGVTDALTYDALNRLTKIRYNTNNASNIPQTAMTYTYDGADRVTKIVDTGGGSPGALGNTQTFGYDNLDDVTSWQSPEGTATYSYDNAGNRTTMVAGGQQQVNYCYDAANRPLSLIYTTPGTPSPCPAANPAPAVSISYDDDGRRHTMSLPNGVSVAYGYDADWHPTTITFSSTGAGGLGTLTYGYDADGRANSESSILVAGKQPAAVSSTSYNAGNQVTNWNGTSVGSDGANNLTSDPTLPTPGSTTWDERNHLSSVNMGGTVNFTYDAAGRRESEAGSVQTSTFLYDGFTPVRTITGSNYADLLAMPGTGEIFSRTDSSGTVVPLRDLAGSTIGLVDSTGKIVTQYAYTPFGRPTMTGTANANPFQFAGMEYDTTGLYHSWARYYSPGLQRFLSEDPAGLNGGDTNVFAYVGNDPINMIDSLGLGPSGLGALPGHGPSWSNCFGDCPDPHIPVFPSGQAIGVSSASAIGVSSETVGFIAPFKILPQNPNDSPGPGWVRRGPNWYNPDTGQSLHPDLGHGPPIGPHWDLHQRGQAKWMLRMLRDLQLEFWLDGPDLWLPFELLP